MRVKFWKRYQAKGLKGLRLWPGRGPSPPGPFENLPHFPGQTIGLIDAAYLRVAAAGAQQPGKLAVTVEALVVHLHHADEVEAREDVLEARRQGIEILEVQRGNALPGGARAVHRLADGALGRTPAHQQQIALGRAIDLGHRQRRGQRLEASCGAWPSSPDAAWRNRSDGRTRRAPNRRPPGNARSGCACRAPPAA